ncbi:MAG: uroporphyrinogen decarboxylase family protein [Oscillospiraceae bacterium]|jgi:hypothetical protein
MHCGKREILTLSFSNEGLDRGAVEESMYPWDKTVAAFVEQGLETDLLDRVQFATLPTDNLYAKKEPYPPWENYYNTMMTEPVFDYEQALGLDPIKRIAFRIPFLSYEEEILQDNDRYTLKRDRDGWVRKYHKPETMLVEDITPVVTDEESWEKHKAHTLEMLRLHCTPENMKKAYGTYREGCQRGDFALRLRLQGFFWCPRDLFGIEEHLIAYYDSPELLKEISQFQLDVYKEQLNGILRIVQPSTIFFEEDFSGRNGPMISPDLFDEFIAPYYRELIPFLKERGAGEIFLDTDGDFTLMIPNLMACGIDGVLPVDVNAGVDIVKVRQAYPNLKFWGGFNKLAIIQGPEAIEAEFRRLEPVIRQGGCIICTDHQAAPQTPLAHYRYYLQRLREVMCEMRGEKAAR